MTGHTGQPKIRAAAVREYLLRQVRRAMPGGDLNFELKWFDPIDCDLDAFLAPSALVGPIFFKLRFFQPYSHPNSIRTELFLDITHLNLSQILVISRTMPLFLRLHQPILTSLPP